MRCFRKSARRHGKVHQDKGLRSHAAGRQPANEWPDFMLSQRNLWHLHYQEGSHRDDHGANLSQRTAQIAGASVDGHQDYLGSTIQSVELYR